MTYSRVYQPRYKVANTPFHIQWDYIIVCCQIYLALKAPVDLRDRTTVNRTSRCRGSSLELQSVTSRMGVIRISHTLNVQVSTQ